MDLGGLNRRDFLRHCGLGAAALALMPTACVGPDRAARPNFVFLLVDDLGWSDLSCFGNTFHETPNADRLAATGMRFTSAYAACAVCSPTRASIQTGKYPVRLGITDWIPGERHRNKPLVTQFTKTELPRSEKTIAEALGEQGYQTAFLGKWHLGGAEFYPEHHGFDVNVAGNHKGHPHDGYFSPYNLENLKDGPPGEYLTDRLTDEAVRLLDRFQQQPDKPFLLFMSYYTVHTPIQAKPALRERYAKKRDEMPDPHWKNAAYAGMVESLDESVGRILDQLEQLGFSDDTVVILMSDNGGVDYAGVTSNHPLRAGKGRYYEGGIRAPMIVRWPGVTQPGSTCDAPVISMDFYPTMLEMAGLPLDPAQHRDGLSLVPLLKGDGRLEREALYWHYPHYHGSGAKPCSAVRKGDFKLLRHYADGLRELFDLTSDPREEQNLAPAKPEIVADLEARLDAWLQEVGAYIPVPRE
jgi:arylsulfatase A-like enzyme